MAGLATRMTKTTLEHVTSFDVISKGMRDYYKELSGRDGEVTHRFITSKSVAADPVAENNDSSKITVGHIGSLYDESDFYNFLSVFHEFARMKNKEPVVHMWGCHLPPDKIPNDFRSSVVFHPTLPEDQIIPKLAGCTFVYAMYPMLKRFRLFTKTSLPTKLASYTQAKRPIFGHGPSESTLAEFLNTTRTGEIWDNTSKASGLDVFEKILHLDPGLSEWQNARDQYFGEKNIEIIRKCVLNLN
jgi:hypothetical protein